MAKKNGFGFDINRDQKIDRHTKEETRKQLRDKTLDITNLTKSKPTQ